MIILSHRGYWQEESEKNTIGAFERSFSQGFGTETDIRDRAGELVISHDPPGAECMSADEFFDLYRSFDTDLCLALNIKADGLQDRLKDMLRRFGVCNYFVFDMSVPDSLGYLRQGMCTFTRQSEYETMPSFYDQAAGVWLDEFNSHWINQRVIAEHLAEGKRICIVSPELHGRKYLAEWQDYKDFASNSGQDFMLCTDRPEEAKEFFYDNQD